MRRHEVAYLQLYLPMREKVDTREDRHCESLGALGAPRWLQTTLQSQDDILSRRHGCLHISEEPLQGHGSADLQPCLPMNETVGDREDPHYGFLVAQGAPPWNEAPLQRGDALLSRWLRCGSIPSQPAEDSGEPRVSVGQPVEAIMLLLLVCSDICLEDFAALCRIEFICDVQ